MRGGKTETCAYNPTTGEKQNLSEALAALGANRREAAIGALAAVLCEPEAVPADLAQSMAHDLWCGLTPSDQEVVQNVVAMIGQSLDAINVHSGGDPFDGRMLRMSERLFGPSQKAA
jgi:hypothetical protein